MSAAALGPRPSLCIFTGPEVNEAVQLIVAGWLLVQLFEMTEIKDLGPQVEIAKRVAKLKSVLTQIHISNCHNMPLLPNAKNLQLDKEEMALLKKAGNAVWDYW